MAERVELVYMYIAIWIIFLMVEKVHLVLSHLCFSSNMDYMMGNEAL